MTITRTSYFVCLLIVLASAYSQYQVRGLSPILGMFIVYGIPILATSLTCGPVIIRKAFNNMGAALKYGLSFFGIFTVLGNLASTAIFYIILTHDPTVLSLLNKPNPVLQIPPEFAWVMIVVSLLVVGPAEEYIFTGLVYGGIISLYKNRRWLSLAFISSIFFATAHFYYAYVYEIASIIIFTQLVAFGMAMAATYYVSDGNLIIPALIHGLYDATAFLGVAISPEITFLLRGAMILIGIILSIIILIQRLLGRLRKRG